MGNEKGLLYKAQSQAAGEEEFSPKSMPIVRFTRGRLFTYRMHLLFVQVCVVLLWFHPLASLSTPIYQEDLTLTLLTDNDLYAEDTTRTSRAILIETKQSRNTAPSACGKISETLWAPDQSSQNFKAGLNNTLSHQAYIGKYPSSQRFWINSPSGCKTIDTKGNIHDENCHSRLPALCTNTAPLGDWLHSDTSAPYQVSRKVGKQVVTGYRDQNSFRFLGLRFAENPGRFNHTTLYEGTGAASALTYGPQCAQTGILAGRVLGDEDCTFLNLWTPYLPGKGANSKNLKPVMVWLHGGGLLFGNASDPGTDGGNIASRGDIVAISVGYRLGNLGWMSFNKPGHDGNYGLGDMITALKWIKANVKAYGGDPNKVTLIGESGSSGGIRALLASKKTKGLLHGAILESGPWGFGPPKVYSEFYTSQYSAATGTLQVAQEAGCGSAVDKLKCLTEKPVADVQNTPSYINYPLIDKNFLFGDYGVTGKSYAADVPILIGTIRDEIANIVYLYAAGSDNATQIVEFVGTLALGEDLTQFVGHPAFPAPAGLSPADTAFAVANRIIADYSITCLSWSTAYSLDKHDTSPAVYAYMFNRTYQPPGDTHPAICSPPKTAEHPNGDFDAPYYKCHAGEVLLTFGDIKYLNMIDRDGLDIPFSQFVLDKWAAFVRTGNPNLDMAYLKARGFWNTIDRVAQAGDWEKLNWKNPKIRVIQWDSHPSGFTEVPQCAAMGLPVTYYEDL